jgi:hypothetical protein
VKRLLLLLALLGSAFGQTIVRNTDIGPFRTLATTQTWTTENAAYMYTPRSGLKGACLYVTPNPVDANAHALTLATWVTGDQTAASGAGIDFGTTQTNGKWTPVGGINIKLPANNGSPSAYWVPYNGAATIVLVLNGGTGAGTFDVFVVESDTPCLGGANSTRAGGQVPVYCDGSVSFVVATGATTKILSNDGTGYGVHICAISITIAGATVTAGTNLIVYGTGATCGTSSNTAARYANGTSTFTFAQNGAGGELYGNQANSLAGRSVCYTDGGSTAGSNVNVTFAVY